MDHYEGVLPAVLADNEDVFLKRLHFAQNEVDAVHIDFIDGVFVANKTLPIEKWPKVTCRYSEAHLMAREPIRWLELLKKKNITRAIVHIESSFNLEKLLQEAKHLDMLITFAISPDSQLNQINQYLERSNCFQVMGVMPGMIGQVFLESTYLCLNYLLTLRNQYQLIVSVDGGVRQENIAKIKARNVQSVITSAALYHGGDWHNNLVALQEEWENES